MSRFWSSVVHTLSPYVPGEQPKQGGLIKLNTNENPYPPSPRALAAIAASFDRLRLYPDPGATALREAIATRYGVAPDQVFCGNGSDEILAHTFQALLKHDARAAVSFFSWARSRCATPLLARRTSVHQANNVSTSPVRRCK